MMEVVGLAWLFCLAVFLAFGCMFIVGVTLKELWDVIKRG